MPESYIQNTSSGFNCPFEEVILEAVKKMEALAVVVSRLDKKLDGVDGNGWIEKVNDILQKHDAWMQNHDRVCLLRDAETQTKIQRNRDRMTVIALILTAIGILAAVAVAKHWI